MRHHICVHMCRDAYTKTRRVQSRVEGSRRAPGSANTTSLTRAWRCTIGLVPGFCVLVLKPYGKRHCDTAVHMIHKRVTPPRSLALSLSRAAAAPLRIGAPSTLRDVIPQSDTVPPEVCHVRSECTEQSASRSPTERAVWCHPETRADRRSRHACLVLLHHYAHDYAARRRCAPCGPRVVASSGGPE